jgi:signal transduction histidine kinase
MPKFRILRYFSATSLVFVVLAALALAMFYRYVAIQGIVQLGEQANITLAQMALNALRPQLVEYLDVVADHDQVQAQFGRGKELEREIRAAMHDTAVQRIKLYNQRGIVAYSTKTEQAGRDQGANPGFATAIRGQISSKLIYRDSFNAFDATTEDDNLIQTYLPVRASPGEPIKGVFEIYTDVNAMVNEAERSEIVIVTGAGVVLLLLYGAMIVIVGRAQRIIDSQQNVIRERTHTLELLAAKLFTAQETEKKRIAGGLHEGIAQTLAAVKAHLENAALHNGAKRTPEDADATQAMVALVQRAIREARAFATDLRPSSLDDLGIADTVAWYCRHFREAHPEVRLEEQVDIGSRDVSVSLGVIIYRILQDVLEGIVRNGRASAIRIALERKYDSIVFTIEDDSLPTPDAEADPERRVALAALQERVTLSGDHVQTNAHPQGGTTIRATWPA